MNFPFFPPAASLLARNTDLLCGALLALSALTLLAVFGPMLIFIVKYRRGKQADRRPVLFPETIIEVTWTVIPTLLFSGLFVWGANDYWMIEHPPADAMEIEVVGKQWMWKIQHPEGTREINELHVPAGRNIKVTLASEDVIHSFFIPAFRIKQDAVPGRYSTLWFQAAQTGVFHLFCSEYCGTQHSAMVGSVIVMAPRDYEQWLARAGTGAGMVERGRQLYRELGCGGCHEGSAVIRAPSLHGLFNRPTPLQNGVVIVADAAYLRDSILLPAKEIAAGYDNIMPSFQGRLSEEDLFPLIEFLKNLR